ncbi:MAG: DUF4248 domain-containing protein [Bacteroidaceae bacterium]|nr:DUF4248 domain-containing protein [Bacteroidaceae bacterium]
MLIPRYQIAETYFPAPTRRQSVAKMRYWLNGDPLMMTQLLKVGYRPYTHYFTPEIVNVFKTFFS